MRRFLTIQFIVISILFFFIGPVLADDETDVELIFLPLISNEKTINHWLGPDGGFVISLVASPFDPKVIYAGTYGNGVFRSLDGGLSWEKASIGLGDLWVNSLAIDPQNPKILDAGTYNDEIYKTTNGGDTWFHSSQGIQNNAVIYSIGIDPNNPDIIYIGTRGKDAVKPPPWNGVVYRSTNEGINWSPVLENVGGANQQDWAYDIVVNPKDHCMVFVAMHEYGVYRSLDCGESWTNMNGNGLTDPSGRALAINPNGTNSNALYYATWHRTGVFKSTNNGLTWNHQNLDSKIYSMDLDPQQPDVVYMADFYSGILKTSNGGNSWTNIGLGENLLYNVMVNPTLHNQVFVGTAGNGIFRSDQSGAGWVHSQRGLNNSMVTGIQVNPSRSDYLFASTSRGGFHATQNGGESWAQLNQQLSDLDVKGFTLHPQNSNQVYLWTYGGGLYSCTLPDCVWKQKNSGLPTLDLYANSILNFFPQNEIENEILMNAMNSDFYEPKAISYPAINDLEFSISNPAVVYLASSVDGIYRSRNGTENWVQAGLSGKNVHKLAIPPANSEVVYASLLNSALVYTTNDGGNSWSSSQVPGGIVNDLAVSKNVPGVIFVATNGGVYRRSGAETWQLLGLSGKVITALAIHPQQPGLMVAGSQGFVYYSKDGGLNWISGPGDLMQTNIRTIAFDPNSTQSAYLGTSTQGIYHLRLR